MFASDRVSKQYMHYSQHCGKVLVLKCISRIQVMREVYSIYLTKTVIETDTSTLCVL